jgi:putative SOS response-associated peptidase YedK
VHPATARKQSTETADQRKMRDRQHVADVRDAYRRRRCILLVDGFFEWRHSQGQIKQPYAIAMKDGYPFGLGGIWENWKDFGRVGANLRDHHHGRGRDRSRNS